jgi:lipopolysaccharide transport system ATP-binding protein
LACAAITLLDPEVLITDEVLAVGDETFQRKCNQWFDRFRSGGGTLVLCSHDLFQIQRLCPRAMWLESGRVAQVGDSREVIRAYRASLGGEEEGGEVVAADGVRHVSGQRAGLAYEVLSLSLQDESGREVRVLPPDSTVLVTADLYAEAGVPHVHIGITRDDLTPVYGVSSDMEGAVPEALGDGRYRYEIRFLRLPLTAGPHRLRAHALDETGTRLYDTVEIEFSVMGDDEGRGLVRLDWQWEEEGEG